MSRDIKTEIPQSLIYPYQLKSTSTAITEPPPSSYQQSLPTATPHLSHAPGQCYTLKASPSPGSLPYPFETRIAQEPSAHTSAKRTIGRHPTPTPWIGLAMVVPSTDFHPTYKPSSSNTYIDGFPPLHDYTPHNPHTPLNVLNANTPQKLEIISSHVSPQNKQNFTTTCSETSPTTHKNNTSTQTSNASSNSRYSHPPLPTSTKETSPNISTTSLPSSLALAGSSSSLEGLPSNGLINKKPTQLPKVKRIIANKSSLASLSSSSDTFINDGFIGATLPTHPPTLLPSVKPNSETKPPPSTNANHTCHQPLTTSSQHLFQLYYKNQSTPSNSGSIAIKNSFAASSHKPAYISPKDPNNHHPTTKPQIIVLNVSSPHSSLECG